ncbi:MAG: ATP synthase F1 subunit gamma [Bacilli bacterium]|nr:ATP synthase F1 subunit gamma [Bacillales bacterium]MDY2575514.1 ATP synthase F1 subunit gamma [Bacilli bacterium]
MSSQGLTNTKRRISSVTSTKKITKAMELVASAKLRKWRSSMDNIISYLNTMEEIISTCASVELDDPILELKKFKNAKSNLYIVVTSSLGLCGGYNYNLFKFLNGKISKEDKVWVLGTKGLVKLSHEDLSLEDKYVSFLDKFDYSKVANLKNEIIKEYSTGQYMSVQLITTTYKNSLTFIPKQIQVLPLENLSKNVKYTDVIFEPNRKEVLSLVVPKYLQTLLYGRLTEAIVCEQAARRNAMDSATDNAEELLDKLHIEYNKARQGAITQEITEVIGGSINK